MVNEFKKIKEFYNAFGVASPEVQTPTLEIKDPKLRHALMAEENDEYLEAVEEGDIVKIADAITDMSYILFGTAFEHGLADKLYACFCEVHRSNMSKLGNDGKPVFREDGKILKGPDYSRPDLKPILESKNVL